jgi:hypothetical protein
MVDPVNLNIPGFDYLFFALLFFVVVALFTVVLARAERTLQRMQRAQATQSSPLLESQRVDGGLEWIRVQSQTIVDRAREGQLRRRSDEAPSDLIEEAEK